MDPCIMVIFGGTGDLTHRKLMPAVYNLLNEKRLPSNFAVLSVGRRYKTDEQYRDEVCESLAKFPGFEMHDSHWGTLSSRIHYYSLEFSDNEGYPGLSGFLSNLDERYGTRGNRIFYLATAPEYFKLIVDRLHAAEMVKNGTAWQRLVIEKPFGRDLKSARYLNRIITNVFTEKNTFRIDHYLGKEMLQNIMVVRFANSVFEHIWNSKYIDNIQISSSETAGVESRGGYYENAGALRDMIQNHMLQLLALTAMEPPLTLDTESIRDEKVKLIKALERITPEAVNSSVVRGQYGGAVLNGKEIKGYRQEDKVSPESNTETFTALKIYINNSRWKGMPFYLRTGKRLPVKSAEIIVQFRSPSEFLYFKEIKDLEPNLLVIKVQPMEGISMRFNAKKPGTINEIIPVNMDFCQNCEIGINSPEAYERLLFDVIREDSTLFTRWDEVEASWKFTDSVIESWGSHGPAFPNYKPGEWGPVDAGRLLEADGRKWWNV